MGIKGAKVRQERRENMQASKLQRLTQSQGKQLLLSPPGRSLWASPPLRTEPRREKEDECLQPPFCHPWAQGHPTGVDSATLPDSTAWLWVGCSDPTPVSWQFVCIRKRWAPWFQVAPSMAGTKAGPHPGEAETVTLLRGSEGDSLRLHKQTAGSVGS